jgi:hypothetical protein
MQSFPRPSFDAISAWSITVLAFAVALYWVVNLYRFQRRAAYVFSAGLAAILAVAILGDRLGWFARIDLIPPPFVLAVLVALLFFVTVGLSRTGAQLAANLSVRSLIAVQVFRLPLELLMLRAASIELMPIEFSFVGYNYDLLTGLGAAVLIGRQIRSDQSHSNQMPFALVKWWNVWGIACLLVIAVLAVLTSPLVRAFGGEPKHVNTWVLFFPYSLLPLLLVGFATLGHIVLSRKLRLPTLVTPPHVTS